MIERSKPPPSSGTLVFTYVPQVDFAAHVFGQDSLEYGDAMATAAGIWSGIAERLPDGAVMIGTADHGVPAIPEHGKDPRPERPSTSRSTSGVTPGP